MSIHKKLLEFQKLGISIKKDAKNPHFRSNYADLAEVIGKVRPALCQVGITLIQAPCETGLNTILHDDETDTAITGFLPFIGASDPQKLGSNLTYLRRYSLVTMLGLEDDDDDGNVASTPAKAAVVPAMTTESAIATLSASKTMNELVGVWEKLPATFKKDPEVIAMKDQKKAELTPNE